MILPVLHLAEKRLRSFMIQSPDGRDYLNRLAVAGDLPREPATRTRNLFLHHIKMNDLDRHLHNHPWEWCVSLILEGGYTEERVIHTPDGRTTETRVRTLKPGNISILTPCIFHRIVDLHGPETWTAFLSGPKTLDWGFLVPDERSAELEYVSEKLYRKMFEHLVAA